MDKPSIIHQVKRDSIFYHGVGTLEAICEAQRDADFEWHKKEVERIKKELEALFEPTVPMSIDYKKWRTFWEREDDNSNRR